MVRQVLVPPLGQTTDTVTLVRWYRQEGEMVREGEPLFAIETDKAILDVEAQASGVLGSVTASAGQAVPVLAAIAVIAAQDEPVAGRQAGLGAPAAAPGQVQVLSRPGVGRRAAARLWRELPCTTLDLPGTR